MWLAYHRWHRQYLSICVCTPRVGPGKERHYAPRNCDSRFGTHPAFFKSAHYLNLKVVVANIDENYQADVNDVAGKITSNTVLIVGSAGNYGHGILGYP